MASDFAKRRAEIEAYIKTRFYHCSADYLSLALAEIDRLTALLGETQTATALVVAAQESTE